MAGEIVLSVRNLGVRLTRRGSEHLLVDDVSFDVREGECLGILGESGSGKSMTCKAFMGLLEAEFKISGSARFGDCELLSASKETLRRLRGSDICMILQNPMTCFDPLCRIGVQMAEGLREHRSLSRAEVRRKCVETLELMHLASPEDVLEKYPHQLSGGMLQRVMIGLALVMEPRLIVADEPTTAIDAVTQYEIVDEFRRIKRERRTSMIFITHDLGVISRIADDVVVMHDARVCQSGGVREVLTSPCDDYTRFLIDKKRAVMRRFQQAMKADAADGRMTA